MQQVLSHGHSPWCWKGAAEKCLQSLSMAMLPFHCIARLWVKLCACMPQCTQPKECSATSWGFALPPVWGTRCGRETFMVGCAESRCWQNGTSPPDPAFPETWCVLRTSLSFCWFWMWWQDRAGCGQCDENKWLSLTPCPGAIVMPCEATVCFKPFDVYWKISAKPTIPLKLCLREAFADLMAGIHS